MKKIMVYTFFIFPCLLLFFQESSPFIRQAKNWMFGHQVEHSLYEFNASPTITLHVETINGNITIQGWSLPSVAIEVVKEGSAQLLDDIKINYHANAERCEIATMPNESAQIASVSYRIMVPRQSRITAKNQGVIHVEDIHGGVSLVSEEGSVTALNIAGPIFIHAYGKVSASLLHGGCTNHVEINSRHSNVALCTNGVIDADLTASCTHGSINVEQPVLLLPQQTPLNRQAWSYLQRNVQARLGNGGTRFQIFAHEEITISLR